MPITKREMFLAECDRCGDTFGSGEYDYFVWETDVQAEEHVKDNDGMVWRGHVWCENCLPLCARCGADLYAHSIAGTVDYPGGPSVEGDVPCDGFVLDENE